MEDDDFLCPLCCEEIEAHDKNFFPCPCGYQTAANTSVRLPADLLPLNQICRFCLNHIRENLNGLCAACRRPFDDDSYQFRPTPSDEIARINAERKRRKQRQKSSMYEADRSHLRDVKVTLKTLIYVTGLPPKYAVEETLVTEPYFGQFGRIVKLSVSRRPPATTGGRTGENQIAIHVTYANAQDALRAIAFVDGATIENRTLHATYGQTKYCAVWIQGRPCTNAQCTFLHEVVDADAAAPPPIPPRPAGPPRIFGPKGRRPAQASAPAAPERSGSASSILSASAPSFAAAASSAGTSAASSYTVTTTHDSGPALPAAASWASKKPDSRPTTPQTAVAASTTPDDRTLSPFQDPTPAAAAAAIAAAKAEKARQNARKQALQQQQAAKRQAREEARAAAEAHAAQAAAAAAQMKQELNRKKSQALLKQQQRQQARLQQQESQKALDEQRADSSDAAEADTNDARSAASASEAGSSKAAAAARAAAAEEEVESKHSEVASDALTADDQSSWTAGQGTLEGDDVSSAAAADSYEEETSAAVEPEQPARTPSPEPPLDLGAVVLAALSAASIPILDPQALRTNADHSLAQLQALSLALLASQPQLPEWMLASTRVILKAMERPLSSGVYTGTFRPFDTGDLMSDILDEKTLTLSSSSASASGPHGPVPPHLHPLHAHGGRSHLPQHLAASMGPQRHGLSPHPMGLGAPHGANLPPHLQQQQQQYSGNVGIGGLPLQQQPDAVSGANAHTMSLLRQLTPSRSQQQLLDVEERIRQFGTAAKRGQLPGSASMSRTSSSTGLSVPSSMGAGMAPPGLPFADPAALSMRMDAASPRDVPPGHLQQFHDTLNARAQQLQLNKPPGIGLGAGPAGPPAAGPPPGFGLPLKTPLQSSSASRSAPAAPPGIAPGAGLLPHGPLAPALLPQQQQFQPLQVRRGPTPGSLREALPLRTHLPM
ncbi:transcriptional repressor general negative regulator of transcription subunit 4 [Blastocladiella emersonii ATCC 22665]|nr:transcriptional repressor general negative regulator of transcription subunit 4 [Blastocladiella emersonii ATCC 22665]